MYRKGDEREKREEDPILTDIVLIIIIIRFYLTITLFNLIYVHLIDTATIADQPKICFY